MLRPDDMTVGQLVTVLNAPAACVSFTTGDHEVSQWTYDHSLTGVPLQILAIDLPYVVVANMHQTGRRVIDVRETDLMKLSPAYVEALLPPRPQPPVNGKHNGDCICPVCVARRDAMEDMKQCGGK